MVPAWLLQEVEDKLAGGCELSQNDLALYTRALLPSPEAVVDQPPEEASFKWIKRPQAGIAEGMIYMDGSRLYAEWKLAGFCARQGWAMAAYDEGGNLTAAAHGRPPGWIRGINATELWGLLMGARSSDPFSPLFIDCMAVQKGSLNGCGWAGSPSRRYARAWSPVANILEDDVGRVVWMPAHCTAEHEGVKTLSNGQLLSRHHRTGNAAVDGYAKEIAMQDAPPQWQMKVVADATDRLTAVGRWIGQSGAYANHFPLPDRLRTETSKFIRDSEGLKRPKKPRPAKRKAEVPLAPPVTLADFSACPWWVAMRERIMAKSAAARQGGEPE
jgi:hypothetical protein